MQPGQEGTHRRGARHGHPPQPPEGPGAFLWKLQRESVANKEENREGVATNGNVEEEDQNTGSMATQKKSSSRGDEFLPRSDELIAATGGQPLSF